MIGILSPQYTLHLVGEDGAGLDKKVWRFFPIFSFINNQEKKKLKVYAVGSDSVPISPSEFRSNLRHLCFWHKK